MGGAAPGPARRGPSRRYPPLVVVAASVSALAMILPSALRVPAQDPTPVLEFAPVPPTDDQAPNTGNLSSLALGSSDTLSETAPPPPPPPPGGGKQPRGLSCVPDPESGILRQTEDPMSPPCVAYYDGDNGGETWRGVSASEVRVLIYLDVGCPNHECSPDAGTYHDLAAAAKPNCPKTWPNSNPDNEKCDYVWIRVARGLMNYFNARFQTYGRRVHYFAYLSSATNESTRRSDAADNFEEIRPFAVIDYATYNGHNEAYAQAMAARDVLVFSSRTALPNTYFKRHRSFTYGFWPDVERWASNYSSYVCQKVHGRPVSRMGNPPGSQRTGDERVYGIWRTSDPGERGLRLFADLVEQQLAEKCGLRAEAKETYPRSGFAVRADGDGGAAESAVARFMQARVTTVLYLGGIEGVFTQQAASRAYYPEIVVAGDLENDNNQAGRIQNQSVWQNAWGTHVQLRMDDELETIGARAYREGNPHAVAEDSRFANEMYRDHFMLFQAIQVSGPNLSPTKIDQGFHAIPPTKSTSPYVASCYFEPGDYTCVKDAAEMWWDVAAQSPADDQPGCWRLVDGGARSRATDWKGRSRVFETRDAVCTGYDGRFQIDPR